MNLSDLRKVTIKKNLRIRFVLGNGMECVLNEHGVAQIPALRAAPDFNLEDELTRVRAFVVEPAAGLGKTKPRSYTRDEMAAMAAAGGGEGPGAEHEE